MKSLGKINQLIELSCSHMHCPSQLGLWRNELKNRKEVAIGIIKKPSHQNKMSVLCAFAIHASTFLQYALYKAAKGETTVRDDVSNIYKCKTTGYF